MKKVLIGLFALSCVSMAAETNLYLRAGADLNGKFDTVSEQELKVNKEDADDFGWEIAVEATKEVYKNFELGLGLAYQKHGDPKKFSETYPDIVEDDDLGEVDVMWTDEFEMPGYESIPLYVVAKYNFNPIKNFVPYVKANLGYSFNDVDGDFKYRSQGYSEENVYVADSAKVDVKVENGLYYGIGAGFEYNNFTMDLMYQVNQAKAKVTLTDTEDDETFRFKKDYDYSRVTLSFGYKFNLGF